MIRNNFRINRKRSVNYVCSAPFINRVGLPQFGGLSGDMKVVVVVEVMFIFVTEK